MSAASSRQKSGHPARSRVTSLVAHRFILDLFDALQRLRASLGRLYESAGLNEHKFLVLSALADQAPRPSLATELATRARVTRSSMTTVLDDLERRGWVARRRDPADRRIIRVSLTVEGSTVVQAADRHFREICARLLSGIDRRELPRFAALCKTVSEAGIVLSREATEFHLPGKPTDFAHHRKSAAVSPKV